MVTQAHRAHSSVGFFDAVDRAKEAEKRGSIMSYEIVSVPLQGRVVRVQNNNGQWSPYPLFVEYTTV